MTYTNSLNEDGGRMAIRSIKDIIADLSKPVNPKRLKTRQQGGRELTYIPWYQAVTVRTAATAACAKTAPRNAPSWTKR